MTDPKKTLFAVIESEAFRQDAQIVNNLATLTHSIRSNKEVDAFLDHFASYPADGAKIISERISKLLSLSNNEKYLHKYDAALAAYLYIIHALNRAESGKLMSRISLPKNTWWSLQMLMVLNQKESSKKTAYKYNHVDIQHDNYSDAELDSRNSATANIKGVFA